MTIVTVHQAKTQLSRLIKQASEGEEVVIARGAVPVARLVPLRSASGSRKPGSMKGKLRVSREFFEPLPYSELDAWEK